MKETELAEIVINHYKKNGYEIYSEVLYHKKRADIVAIKNNKYIVIETKMSMNLTLLQQGNYWKDKSHKTYICFPSKRRLNQFALQICRDLGIGVIIYKKGKLEFLIESTVCESPDLPNIYDEQKDSVSGSKGGGYVTPFSLTRKRLINYITENGEQSLNFLINNIDHHYKSNNSAKNAISKMINIGVINELKIYKKGRNTWVNLR